MADERSLRKGKQLIKPWEGQPSLSKKENTVKTANRNNANEFIQQLAPFKTQGALCSEVKENGAYVVYSYTTPIAVSLNGHTYVTSDKYSTTTSTHTTQCLIAWPECTRITESQLRALY